MKCRSKILLYFMFASLKNYYYFTAVIAEMYLWVFIIVTIITLICLCISQGLSNREQHLMIKRKKETSTRTNRIFRNIFLLQNTANYNLFFWLVYCLSCREEYSDVNIVKLVAFWRSAWPEIFSFFFAEIL